MGLDITYIPQMVIKSQALADFVVEGTETQQPHPLATQEHWTMYFSPFTLNKAEGGIVFIYPKGDCLLYVIRLHFRVTNNVAKYVALINDLRIAAMLRVQRLYIRYDSELIVNQVMRESNCDNSSMAAYW
jgi:hypothetical protein